MKTTHTATPWELSIIENEIALTGKSGGLNHARNRKTHNRNNGKNRRQYK